MLLLQGASERHRGVGLEQIRLNQVHYPMRVALRGINSHAQSATNTRRLDGQPARAQPLTARLVPLRPTPLQLPRGINQPCLPCHRRRYVVHCAGVVSLSVPQRRGFDAVVEPTVKGVEHLLGSVDRTPSVEKGEAGEGAGGMERAPGPCTRHHAPRPGRSAQ